MEQNYDFKQVEPQMQQLWREHEIYKFDDRSQKKVYSIDTPPPTVSGSLHIGHVFSYAQAEMIARYHRMQGEAVYYPFGFDDNGLPTERLVEKEKQIHAKELKRSEFAKECKEVTDHYEDEFKQMWEALGLSVDWSLKYKTIDPMSMRISQRSFLELAKNKKAYRKESPVLWCSTCQTSIAQAELESTEKKSTFNYLRFLVGEEELIVATTRPELLYGCVCLFVHPDDKRYQKYIGEKATVPLYQFELPILAEESVSMTKGTGVVMCATYGDTTDVEWCEKYQLPYKKVITNAGIIETEVPLVGGYKVLEARKIILEQLQESGDLIRQEAITHAVSVHERCGKEIEIIPSNQWYIDVLSEKERYLEAADEIQWYPKSMKNRYLLWVQNLKWDWCISRQRYFGVPFPVWYCKNCGETKFAEDEMLPVNPLESKPNGVCNCGCQEFIPETAVFDTWATSSVTPLIHAHYKEKDARDEFLPMTLRSQAHEIIRTWAFYTIVKSLYHTGQIPWKHIMISGFVLAKKGEKISKSKNNGSLSPMQLIQTHSADSLRYWCASANLGTDTFFSEEDLKGSKRFLTKLWNAAKFSISHLSDFTMEDKEQLDREYNKKDDIKKTGDSIFLPYDLYLLRRIEEVTYQAHQYLEEYEIGQARKCIDDFFWKDYCDYYIEIVKERLYQPEKHGTKERTSAQYTIYKTLLSILKLYSIYVPHITDYIYQQFYREFEETVSIHSTTWDYGWELKNESENRLAEVDEKKEPSILMDFGMHLNEMIAQVRKFKTESGMSMKDELKQIELTCKEEEMAYFQRSKLDLLGCTKAENLIFKPAVSNQMSSESIRIDC